jgi:hypothetical protein
MRYTLALALALAASNAAGQAFRPYSQERVSAKQWQTYFNEVSAKLAATRQDAPAEFFVGFNDPNTSTTYTFTMPGNPAHPAWFTRQFVQTGTTITVRQIGYFAGDEAQYNRLFRAFQEMNASLRQDMQKRARNPK